MRHTSRIYMREFIVNSTMVWELFLPYTIITAPLFWIYTTNSIYNGKWYLRETTTIQIRQRYIERMRKT